MSIPGLRLDFWNKSFFKETAFGRTLSGRNKTGQVLGVVKDTVLSAVPFIGKPIAQATGNIVDALEAKEMGKRVDELNLPHWAVLAVRILAFAGIAWLVLSGTVGIEEAKELLELFKQAGLA